ncbi:hypothetical protein D3C71_1337270 [compost metagenome]
MLGIVEIKRANLEWCNLPLSPLSQPHDKVGVRGNLIDLPIPLEERQLIPSHVTDVRHVPTGVDLSELSYGASPCSQSIHRAEALVLLNVTSDRHLGYSDQPSLSVQNEPTC